MTQSQKEFETIFPTCVHSKGFHCPICWPKTKPVEFKAAIKIEQPIEFRGHRWLSVKGDALTPARFWDYKLLTDTEYSELPPEKQKEYRPVQETDLALLSSRFALEASV